VSDWIVTDERSVWGADTAEEAMALADVDGKLLSRAAVTVADAQAEAKRRRQDHEAKHTEVPDADELVEQEATVTLFVRDGGQWMTVAGELYGPYISYHEATEALPAILRQLP
jgi:hypothetical protein